VRRTLVGTAVALGVLRGGARAGSADDLAAALRFKAALEWDRALASAERALADGDADPARVIALHELAGELAAGLDRDDVAIEHFAEALALAPDAALAPGTSPKIAARFDAARTGLAGEALRVHVEADPAGAAVVVDDDPRAMIAAVRVRYQTARGVPGELVARGTGRVIVPVPRDARAVELAVVDAHGNALWIGAPIAAAAPRAEPEHAWGATTAWGIAAGGALALSAFAAWRTSVAQDQWNALRADDGHHDYSELAAVETRGRRWALAADVALGAAAATGAIAIVVAIREARRPLEPLAEPRAIVAPLVTPDALGVAIVARF
jgi:hypothetical protein